MTELKHHLMMNKEHSWVFVYYKSETDKVIANQKYKLCLAKSQEWRNYAAFCGMQSSCHNHRGFGKTAEKYSWKECHAWKCVHRYKELAKEFKREYENGRR